MRKIICLSTLLLLLTLPVRAMDYTAPEAPDSALDLMPAQTSSFAADLVTVICAAISKLEPSLAECLKVCAGLFAAVMLISLLKTIPGKSAVLAEFVGILAVAAMLLKSTQSMITLAADTISQLSEYGKLLLPVMTAALASQGGITASTALYAGTVIFDSILASGISNLLIPMVYIFLALMIAAGATGVAMLQQLAELIRWLVTWCLKTILYVFTGYVGITGVVSGSTDAAALKVTKLTMSGMIPVVGGILSDASEAVIVGASVMKNTVGVYGMLALIAIWISPFLKIGLQYLLLKLTAALCGIFDVKLVNELIKAFSTAMGLLLGMVGAVCVLQLISVVCFMKGVS